MKIMSTEWLLTKLILCFVFSFAEHHSSKESSEDSSFSPLDPSHVSLTTESDTDSFLPDQSGYYDSELNGKMVDDQSKLFNSRSLAKASFGDKIPIDNANSASVGEEKSIVANGTYYFTLFTIFLFTNLP